MFRVCFCLSICTRLWLQLLNFYSSVVCIASLLFLLVFNYFGSLFVVRPSYCFLVILRGRFLCFFSVLIQLVGWRASVPIGQLYIDETVFVIREMFNILTPTTSSFIVDRSKTGIHLNFFDCILRSPL